jgi:uncharacterized tellurite resistance protein B-like protein
VGIFDAIFKQVSPEEIALTPEEALMGIIVGSVCADGFVQEEELTQLTAALCRIKLLKHAQVENMMNQMANFVGMSSAQALISKSVKYLPQEMRASAFATAIDLMLSDGVISQPEKEIIEQLQIDLEIPDSLGQEIAKVMLIKNSI